jgi:ABC-type multidrug transport system ATPase subunit
MRPDDASVADDSAPRDGASGGFRLGLGHGAFVEGGVVSEDSGSRAEDWRRRSVDAHIQRTAELAAARRAAAISASASSAVATDSATSSSLAARGPSKVHRAPSTSTPDAASRWNPPIAIEVDTLSLWVTPAFGPAAAAAAAARRRRRLALCSPPASPGCPPHDPTEGMVRVLRDVSFAASPGEMVACVGPSGSGKTSLVTAVAGRLKPPPACVVTGEVRFDGVPRAPHSSRGVAARVVGFVTQDDCAFPALTVRETIGYAAALRLPSAAFTRDAKRRKAAETAHALGLDACLDVAVGGGFLRGVSGGERKRVAVAVELVTDPSVLILDEPTSGLDSTIALRLCRRLRAVAVDGSRTVVLTVHQPSGACARVADAILALSRGRRAYYGALDGIAPHFANTPNVGYRMPFGTNPVEFLLDLANGDAEAAQTGGGGTEGKGGGGAGAGARAGGGHESADGGENGGENATLASPSSPSHPPLPTSADEVIARVVEASENLRVRVGADGEPVSARLGPRSISAERPRRPERLPRWACPWHEQTAHLLLRSLACRREQLVDGLKLAQVTAVASTAGALWYDRGASSDPAAVADVAGLLFFECLFLSFLTLFGALFTFPDERLVAVKERQSGVYRVSAYFVARSLADVPLDLFVPTIFVPIAYWLGGLRATASAFVAHLLAVWLLVLVASSMGLLVGACVTRVKRAQTLASVIMLAVMLTGGFYVDETPPWLRWTKRVSFINHAYALLLKIQFPEGLGGDAREGSDAAAVAFVDLDSEPGVNVGALFAILVGMRLLTYVALRWISLRP